MKFREWFWPLLEKSDNTESTSPDTVPEILIEDDNLDAAFKLESDIAQAEEDRRKSIETKAALLLSTISVASSIVVAANTLVTVNKEFSLLGKISVFISFLLTIYAARTVWFAIKALERGSYHVLSFKDINVGGNKIHYTKAIIRKLQKQIVSNESAINSKVDWLTLSQEYYKRCLVIISIYAFVILSYSVFFSSAKMTTILQEEPVTSNVKSKTISSEDTVVEKAELREDFTGGDSANLQRQK